MGVPTLHTPVVTCVPASCCVLAVPLLSVDDVSSTSITLSLRSAHIHDSGFTTGLSYHGFGTSNEFGKSDSHSKDLRQPLTYTLEISLGATASLLPAPLAVEDCKPLEGCDNYDGSPGVDVSCSALDCAGSAVRSWRYLRRLQQVRSRRLAGNAVEQDNSLSTSSVASPGTGPTARVSSWDWLRGCDDTLPLPLGASGLDPIESYSQVATGDAGLLA